MSEEHKAYETILTDPDVLADYTCEFYGPNGPYPVEEDQVQGQYVGNPGITPQQQQAAAAGRSKICTSSNASSSTATGSREQW